MRILFIGSKRQQMPGFIYALGRMKYESGMYPKPIEEIINDEEEHQLEIFLKKAKVDFVLSNLFDRRVARVTNRLETIYAVWCADSPHYESWLPEADYDNCYLFHFDYREYELKKQNGRHNVYHLPLAADIATSGQMVITDQEIKKYSCDMSFVGSLYTDNLYDQELDRFSAILQDAFTEIIEKSAFVWDGKERLHIPPTMLEAVSQEFPHYYNMPDEYFLRTYLLGRKLTNVERTLMLELLSEQFGIHLYTWDDEKVPEGVRRFPGVSQVDALKVFYSSKINLNITLRSIASGVPARVFDVMSVGGFMLSNWQEEIPELFAEGREIVTYKTPEELIDKADYYLRHDDERMRIGANGYQKVKARHTYEHRLEKIISILFPSP